MTTERAAATIVAELRRLEAAATAPPWRWNSYSGIAARVPEGHPLEDYDEDDPGDRGTAWICWIDGGPEQKGHGDALRVAEARANAELIERMRNALPALLDALAAATAERDALYEALVLVAERAKRLYDGCDEEQMGEDMAEELLLLRHEVQDALALAPDGGADPARKLAAMAPNRPLGAREDDSSATDTTGPNSGDLGA